MFVCVRVCAHARAHVRVYVCMNVMKSRICRLFVSAQALSRSGAINSLLPFNTRDPLCIWIATTYDQPKVRQVRMSCTLLMNGRISGCVRGDSRCVLGWENGRGVHTPDLFRVSKAIGYEQNKRSERLACITGWLVSFAGLYHWLACITAWLVSLAGAATSIISVATKDVFCCDKHVFVTTKHVLCRDKSFVAIHTCF